MTAIQSHIAYMKDNFFFAISRTTDMFHNKMGRCERTVLLTIIVILLVVVVSMSRFERRESCNNNISFCNSSMFYNYQEDEIPFTIVQSWRSRDLVPERIFEAIRMYAPEYKHVFFNDKAVVTFLSQNYPPQVLKVYHSMKSHAHKADLFRYCYLFKHGGVWLDIKTILIRPLAEIFTSRYNIYTVRSIIDHHGATCYQGILAVPPQTSFMHDMIVSYMSLAQYVDSLGYLTFCRQMYAYFEQQYGDVRIGTNNGQDVPTLQLFEEYDKKPCNTERDQYGYCTFVRNEYGEDLFKVRDHEFPKGPWQKLLA